ncbi:hypothetical protein [Anaeromyxobacter oryzisoli]|uniref:hypothetical protein n=1 Tax=Anaeromyxobacter oryzisoli TaxID=2925408 RepID=UPI001F58CF51|nr:hypothetical protein [Anaeromyxobacter sp. SG63]
MRTRSSHAARAALGLLLLAGCGSSASGPSPYALQARLGTYDDGSGRLGTALVATLRDANGAGPSAPWDLTLRNPQGTTVATLQSTAGTGAYLASWYVDEAPSPGEYELVAASGSAVVRTSVFIAAGATGLPVPAPVLATDGSRLDWAPVPGAVAYLCRAYTGGTLQLEQIGTATGCDLSGLAPGAYAVSVLALSADLAALASSTAAAPALPPTIDVSESRLGVARSDGAAAVVLRSVGGAYDDGVGPRSLAVWLSIASADGSATTSTWDLQIIGPNLPASDPLTLTYHANFPRTLAWAPGIPAAQGTYTVTAQSGGAVAVGTFTVGAPAWLDQPLGLVATAGAQGSASATWSAVVGARAYLLSAYDSVSGALVASAWFSGTDGAFPQGTFTPGSAYDVYLAASDADLVLGTVPTQVSVAENVFDFSRFVAL